MHTITNKYIIDNSSALIRSATIIRWDKDGEVDIFRMLSRTYALQGKTKSKNTEYFQNLILLARIGILYTYNIYSMRMLINILLFILDFIVLKELILLHRFHFQIFPIKYNTIPTTYMFPKEYIL